LPSVSTKLVFSEIPWQHKAANYSQMLLLLPTFALNGGRWRTSINNYIFFSSPPQTAKIVSENVKKAQANSIFFRIYFIYFESTKITSYFQGKKICKIFMIFIKRHYALGLWAEISLAVCRKINWHNWSTCFMKLALPNRTRYDQGTNKTSLCMFDLHAPSHVEGHNL